MALGCLTCLKYTLFVFNFIFWLIGCLLLAVGIWALIDNGPVRDYIKENDWKASIIIYAVITLGSIITLAGFLGCCGSIRESRCLLTLFFILMFVIHGIFISAGLFVMINREKSHEWITPPKKENTSAKLQTFIQNYEIDPGSKAEMEKIQSQYRCCGADTGIQDYKDIRQSVDSLCKKRFREKPCTNLVYRKENERYEKLVKDFSKNVVIFAAILLGICFIMIVGMTVSIALCCALKTETIR